MFESGMNYQSQANSLPQKEEWAIIYKHRAQEL